MKLPNMLVVMSACQSALADLKNDSNTAELNRLLSYSYHYGPAMGCYKGKLEDSFVVQVDDFREVGHLVELAERFKQESILLVDSRDKAFLYVLGTKEMRPLGPLYQTDRIPESADAFTLYNGLYYYTI
ncbi:hypothetical protein MA13_gp08 [Pectobacterium phage MA13]|uniref:Uncharacterized protein n=1 Tax=Pectobacterium phage MA13 TaxID=2662284 RepID=A0A5Q2F3D9_9CAUD|nr:hypothetical protein MA13_gp08 [Pectobacterium phage MA13]